MLPFSKTIMPSTFQFLIGRLGTEFYAQKIIVDKEFQFLIGRLGTRSDASYCREGLPFQFLIGRLGTVQIPRPGPQVQSFNSS